MKIILVLLALAFSVEATTPGFCYKFGIGIPYVNWMWSLPQTKADAVSSGYIQVDRSEDSPMSSLTMYCKEPYSLCIFYEPYGCSAGGQINILEEQFTNRPYDLKAQGLSEWTPTINGTTRKYISAQFYTTSEEILAKNTNSTEGQCNTTLANDFVSVSTKDGSLMTIYKDLSVNMTNEDSMFTEEACIPGMGTHYFYNMSSTTECSESSLLPWFFLGKDDELVGIGLNVFGNKTIDSDETDCFEHPTKSNVELIIPKAPECIYNATEIYGILTMHIYFMAYPFAMLCV